jgi:hypothetical protein
MSGMDGDGGERLTARVGGQDQKTDQDGGGTDVGQNCVPRTGAT